MKDKEYPLYIKLILFTFGALTVGLATAIGMITLIYGR